MTQPLTLTLDHLTITAPTLEAGADYVEQTLGVRPQAGGVHERMGTHNLLLRLGETQFLEVIAIHPDKPAPLHPRWFDLDNLPSDAIPALRAWVAQTPDIRTALPNIAEALTTPLGEVEPMHRGDLNWLISIPTDGSLPAKGLAPILIEWGNTRNTPPSAFRSTALR